MNWSPDLWHRAKSLLMVFTKYFLSSLFVSISCLFVAKGVSLNAKVISLSDYRQLRKALDKFVEVICIFAMAEKYIVGQCLGSKLT
jgi:esterase/lipase superfamily enzyme